MLKDFRPAVVVLIGLTLITVVATLGAGLKTTDRNGLEKQIGGRLTRLRRARREKRDQA
jgi:hypothetical protein